jgi:hypothetical protein
MTTAVHTESETLRQKTLEVAKRHKASWIEFGQYLYTVYRDKHFRGWGFLTFETYCGKELRIKQATAMKLLKSYSFLEKEEPRFVKEAMNPDGEDMTAPLPSYESVNLLRLARENSEISAEDFSDLRQAVLVQAREPKDVRSQVKKILQDAAGEETEAERSGRRNSKIRRMLSFLTALKKEMEEDDLLPGYLLKQIDDLKRKLEDQIRD